MKKSFLQKPCPFKVLEEKVTWGYFISLQIQAFAGAIGLIILYFLFICLADVVGVY